MLRFKALLRDHPIIPLLVLLALLVGTLEIMRPGIVGERKIARRARR